MPLSANARSSQVEDAQVALLRSQAGPMSVAFVAIPSSRDCALLGHPRHLWPPPCSMRKCRGSWGDVVGCWGMLPPVSAGRGRVRTNPAVRDMDLGAFNPSWQSTPPWCHLSREGVALRGSATTNGKAPLTGERGHARLVVLGVEVEAVGPQKPVSSFRIWRQPKHEGRLLGLRVGFVCCAAAGALSFFLLDASPRRSQ